MKTYKTNGASDFYCVCCGKKGIPVLRRIGKEKEPGHLKKLFCIYCGREVNHAEVRPNGKYTYVDFSIEYHFGNFTKDGDRILPYKQFEAKVEKECGIHV